MTIVSVDSKTMVISNADKIAGRLQARLIQTWIPILVTQYSLITL